MPEDAIVGAEYRDTVFEDTFTLVDVTPDEDDSYEPSEIQLTLDYEQHGEMTITLEQFQQDDDIEVVDIPG